jgi:hypothetical protein
MKLLLAILLVLLAPSTALGESAPCGPQDYDSTTAPDFSCPGPEEEALTADLNPPASVPVHQGWRLVDSQGRSTILEWDGALVHRDRLLDYGLRLHAVRRLRWADRLRLNAEYDIDLQNAEDVCQARVGLVEAERTAYRERLQTEEQRTASAEMWYRSWWFGAIVGVVATAAVVALTAYALHAVD